MRNRELVGLVCLLVVVGCAGDADFKQPGASPDDDLVALGAELGGTWRAVFDDRSRTPTFLVATSPPSGAVAATDAAVRARAFLSAHPKLFGGAGRLAVDVLDVKPDPLGGTRVKLGVRIEGLPLDGGDIVVLLGRDGAVRSVSGRFDFGGTLLAPPTRDAASAAMAAIRGSAAEPSAPVWVDGAPALVAFAQPPGVRAAWRVTVAAPNFRRDVFVDASTGAIFHVRDDLRRVDGSGLDVHGRPRPLSVFRLGLRRWELADSAHRVRTFAGLDGTSPLASDDREHWDENVFGAGAAVDAHANAGQVLDYLRVTFGRDGLDGRGGDVRIVAHPLGWLPTAYWDGRRAVFGDGNGDGSDLLPLAAGLDIVAHELFHGVTQAESGLVGEGQSGALAESISDVFGCLVELDRDDGDWTIGDRISAQPIRDLTDPARTHDPAHMRQYWNLPIAPETDMGGVHKNSVIASHAAYLVVAGGLGPLGDVSVAGVGDAAVRDVWWRASTMYIGPSARFADFAEATVAAAEDLYGAGSVEARSVADAWRAVGVRSGTVSATASATRSASFTHSFTETPW